MHRRRGADRERHDAGSVPDGRRIESRVRQGEWCARSVPDRAGVAEPGGGEGGCAEGRAGGEAVYVHVYVYAHVSVSDYAESLPEG